MPLFGVRYRSKRIGKGRYVRLAFRNGKVVEAVVKSYKRRSKRMAKKKKHKKK